MSETEKIIFDLNSIVEEMLDCAEIAGPMSAACHAYMACAYMVEQFAEGCRPDVLKRARRGVIRSKKAGRKG